MPPSAACQPSAHSARSNPARWPRRPAPMMRNAKPPSDSNPMLQPPSRDNANARAARADAAHGDAAIGNVDDSIRFFTVGNPADGWLNFISRSPRPAERTPMNQRQSQKRGPAAVFRYRLRKFVVKPFRMTLPLLLAQPYHRTGLPPAKPKRKNDPAQQNHPAKHQGENGMMVPKPGRQIPGKN